MLQRYIDNTCTEEERRMVWQYLQEQDAPALEHLLDEGWNDHVPPMPTQMAAELDNRLSPFLIRRRTRQLFYRWAAAAAILLLAAGWWRFSRPIATHDAPVPLASREISNATTTVKRLTLPDGSHIWLTPGARIQLDDDFNLHNRRIALSGEAYFEVAPAAMPFIVDGGDLQTTVLGTHFNMEAWPGERSVSVSLSAGKVAVKHADSTMILQPGIKLTYRKTQHTFITRHFSTDNETNWKRGAIVMDDIPLEAAFHRLEARYHKKIIWPQGAFREARFTATFEQTPLAVILHNMAFIHGFSYQTKGDTVLIQN
ncbi:FecR family protein [Chitinophaga vietnamensis]|uniref:FecR family protein n=1 Tax=Chitinophaga vietnamensis TaxID=2593957 RepID=UPI001375A808|nr:FecR domain-containing protein [Chitinophaga vietnamensis]